MLRGKPRGVDVGSHAFLQRSGDGVRRVSTPIRPLFGLEFEMAFAAFGEQDRRMSSRKILPQFMATACSLFDHLPARRTSGVFLGNGARLYLDCGKPEITTPEVLTPTDAVRYSRAGEEILLKVSRELVARLSGLSRIVMSRANVSYTGSGSSWACHESYSWRRRRNMGGGLAENFIPHAISRIIYTGAGGFDNCSLGIRFLISPRVSLLNSAISETTQRDRGIYNTKDEPLNDMGYKRLHVICGEHQSSIRSQWLKIATSAVVLAMTEAGVSPGEQLQPRNPVAAMRDFARDTTLTASTLMRDGTRLTAIEIQRRLLEKAKQFTVDGPLNEWLPACCQLWEETLDRLQEGVTAVQRTLDWAIKLDLFRNYVARRDLTWDRLEAWNSVLEKMALSSSDAEHYYFRMARVAHAGRLFEELRGRQRELDPDATLDWSELELVLDVRQELFEIDTRFGELGENGFFNALDAQGFLEHDVPGVENIQEAMVEPPGGGRACLRGRAVRAISQNGGAGACEWDCVRDYTRARQLDLSDPFASEEKWSSLACASGDHDSREVHLMQTLERALSSYDRGEYETAQQLLIDAVTESVESSRNELVRCGCRLLGWIQARRGYTDGTFWLSVAYQFSRPPLDAVCDQLTVHRFEGLCPAPAFRECCTSGLRLLRRRRDADPRIIVAVRCSRAYDLLRQDRPVDSWNAYHDHLRPEWMQLVHRRFFAQILAEKADVLRRLGRMKEALRLLGEAKQIQWAEGFGGDMADLTLTQQAKIEAQTGQMSAARRNLRRALEMQSNRANVVGEARTRLLLARLGCEPENAEMDCDRAASHDRVSRLREDRPALAQCRLTKKILAHWDEWIAGAELDEADLFWGL